MSKSWKPLFEFNALSKLYMLFQREICHDSQLINIIIFIFFSFIHSLSPWLWFSLLSFNKFCCDIFNLHESYFYVKTRIRNNKICAHLTYLLSLCADLQPEIYNLASNSSFRNRFHKPVFAYLQKTFFWRSTSRHLTFLDL
jgi:hypothetical protein